MNSPIQIRQSSGSAPSLQMDEAELISVLQNSIYPGAKLESIKMVTSYCRAGGLDPLQKPVHIVQMDVSTGEKNDKGWDIKVKRDVILPGIGLYRTQAARTGEYLGQSEPEFGPTKVLKFREKKTEYVDGRSVEKWVDAEIEYPEWCKVTVSRRLHTGDIAKHTAYERWIENYATKGYDGAPNSMWKKRPYGQLAKCAEAQALRKAFPEIGAAPTAEEMEGKSFDDAPSGTTIDGGTGEIIQKPAAPARPALEMYTQERFDANFSAWSGVIQSRRKTPEELITMLESKALLSEEQKNQLRAVRTENEPQEMQA